MVAALCSRRAWRGVAALYGSARFCLAASNGHRAWPGVAGLRSLTRPGTAALRGPLQPGAAAPAFGQVAQRRNGPACIGLRSSLASGWLLVPRGVANGARAAAEQACGAFVHPARE